MTNDTTAQATVLTEEQLEAIANDWRWHVDHDPNNTIPTWLLLAMPQLITSHRALTEQVRVLREALEPFTQPLVVYNEDFYERGSYDDMLHQVPVPCLFRARRALAALEGEVGE